LYDPYVRVAHAPDQVRAWHPAVPGITEVFHARFAKHAYPAHAHGTWTLFIVDDGAIRYDLDRHPHGSDRSMVGLLPPHVAHDGRSATSHGYRKRVLYLDGDVFGEHLIGPAVDRPMIPDPSMYGRLSMVHELLVGADDAFEAESRLAFVVQQIRGHLSDRTDDKASIGGSALAEQLRALLDAHMLETLTLASAGRLLGASPAHLVRSFSKTFGVAPHAYRLGRRIEIARQRLLDGQPPADVAASVGFYDQSHFTRHFKRHVGATPGRYAAGPRRFATAG
jgi:AraC-like DNA-binding protein